MGGFPPNKMENRKSIPIPQNLGLGHIHAYTKRSVYKKAYLNVLLLGILISQGYNEIQEIYKLKKIHLKQTPCLGYKFMLLF